MYYSVFTSLSLPIVLLFNVITPIVQDSTICLRGKTGPQVIMFYSLTDDIELKKKMSPTVELVKAQLVVNGVPIQDNVFIDYLRNNYIKSKIKKTKYIPPNTISNKYNRYYDINCDNWILFVESRQKNDTVAEIVINPSDVNYFNEKYGLDGVIYSLENKKVLIYALGKSFKRFQILNAPPNNCIIIRGNDNSFLMITNKEDDEAVIVFYKPTLSSNKLDDILKINNHKD